uniref:Uncharacterized protein n=1 Tax=Opuntia streptacantha TaxID=393608 RepID=A0A7C8YDM0_OPUST
MISLPPNLDPPSQTNGFKQSQGLNKDHSDPPLGSTRQSSIRPTCIPHNSSFLLWSALRPRTSSSPNSDEIHPLKRNSKRRNAIAIENRRTETQSCIQNQREMG